jgi:hypothetical protein
MGAMTLAAVGHSLLLETETATRQAWSTVVEELGAAPDCALVFATGASARSTRAIWAWS